MSLVTWFRHGNSPKTSTRLEALLGAVVAYLRSCPTGEEIVPKIVGAVIGETEVAAFACLAMLERQGITKQHYGVYCGSTQVPLESFDDLSQMKNSYSCETCDLEHSVEDGTCRVEVYFTVDNVALTRWKQQASAA